MIWRGTFPRDIAYNRTIEYLKQVFRYIHPDHHDRIYIGLTELLSNSIKHSEVGEIEVLFELGEDFLRFEVMNQGHFMPQIEDFFMPVVMAEGGRGIPLAYLHTDSLKYLDIHNATRVVAAWTTRRWGR